MGPRRRLAIVGLGMALKPHIRSLEELSDRVEIAACYAPSAERRKAFSAAHGYPVVDDLDGILRDRSIEAAVILTPPHTHLELVERCAAVGKHVLLEKPIDGTVARARRAVEAMERAGCRLAIVLQHRFRAVSRRLAELVSSGELGRLVSGSASIRWWRPPEYFAQPGRGMKARDGGGVLLTQAIHTLDLFQSLAGEIAEVSAFATTSPLRKIDTEDIVGAGVRFTGGDYVVVWLLLLQHQPHRFYVLPGMAPIALGVQVAEAQFLRLPGKNPRDSGSDFPGDEFEPAARRFVIEQDPCRSVKPVRLTMIPGQVETRHLTNAISGSGVKRRILGLQNLADLAEHLAGTGEVEAAVRRQGRH